MTSPDKKGAGQVGLNPNISLLSESLLTKQLAVLTPLYVAIFSLFAYYYSTHDVAAPVDRWYCNTRSAYRPQPFVHDMAGVILGAAMLSTIQRCIQMFGIWRSKPIHVYKNHISVIMFVLFLSATNTMSQAFNHSQSSAILCQDGE